MGMMGIDEEYALLKMVRADLSVKRKKLTDKAQTLTAEEMAYLQYRSARPAYLFA